MRYVLLLTCVVAFAAPVAAQPAVLQAADELAQQGECEAALGLLAHAQGTTAELAGRRALCEGRLGRRDEAARDVAIALGSPSDPWVTAHRDALLAALRSDASAASSSAPSAAASPERPAVVMDAELVAEFGTNPPPDAPVARVGASMGRRLPILRLRGGLGYTSGFDGRVLKFGDGTFVADNGVTLDCATYAWDVGGGRCGRGGSGPRVSFGAELEEPLSRRFSLVGALGVVVEGGLGGSGLNVVYSPGSSTFTLPGSKAGALFGLDLEFLARIRPRRHAAFVDLGGRYSFLAQRWTAVYRAGAGATVDTTAHALAHGGQLQGVLDVGGRVGTSRRGQLFVRVASGIPIFAVELHYSHAIWSPGR